MRVELRSVSKGLALPSTSVEFASGEVVVAVAETEQRPTVLGLIASGRMRSETGLVLIDGREDAATLRRRVALVDAPSVSDPAPDVTVAGVTAEELMFAGRAAHPIAVRGWLDAAGFGALGRTPIGDVPARKRIALLLELGALREGVEGIVLVSPDRHGGDPVEWMQLAGEYAARGMAVLVIVGDAAASLLRLSAGGPEPVPSGIQSPGGAEPASGPAAASSGIQSPGAAEPASGPDSAGLAAEQTESRTGERADPAEPESDGRESAGPESDGPAPAPAAAPEPASSGIQSPGAAEPVSGPDPTGLAADQTESRTGRQADGPGEGRDAASAEGGDQE